MNNISLSPVPARTVRRSCYECYDSTATDYNIILDSTIIQNNNITILTTGTVDIADDNNINKTVDLENNNNINININSSLRD